MKNIIFFALLLLSLESSAQLKMRYTFHDHDRKIPKEIFQVNDSIQNTLHGQYISYYPNGLIAIKGNYNNNETADLWEFFYETGILKMRGALRGNSNFGIWEYFSESGHKSMEGFVNGKNREGTWTTYYENGQIKEVGEYENNLRIGQWKTYFAGGNLQGEIHYRHGTGQFTAYDTSGVVEARGYKSGTLNVGWWRYFEKDGSLHSEGMYLNGKKQGDWICYYTDGKISSRGLYIHDKPSGFWQYFKPNGKLSHSGVYENGTKLGEWKSFFNDGSCNSETIFHNATAEYREFYPSGKLKIKGKTVDEKREGLWTYYYEDGRKAGECNYQYGMGTYYGYFSNGNLQSQGQMDGDRKRGTWEIYDINGQLSGFYRPFYENKIIAKDIVPLSTIIRNNKKNHKERKRAHFGQRLNEFQGLIVKGNPLMVFAGRLPLGVEFYAQERLGHEFEFTGIRDPFFKSDYNIPSGDYFQRGYSICIKQKLYNPVKVGMWYLGHEIRFTNFGHFINQPLTPVSTDLFMFTTVEQRIEWGLLLGHRISNSTCGKGFTMDAFISGNVGYRGLDGDPKYKNYLPHLNQSKVSSTFHFGLHFGNVFSFR